MPWGSPFVVYRLTKDGKLEEVFRAEDLKKAKYWLTYIAQPWDVLCKTPAHPKHSKSNNKPEYWSHKEQSGVPTTEENRWREYLNKSSPNADFPDEQAELPKQ